MTVEELIEELKQYDGKMQVVVSDGCLSTTDDVEVVYIEEDNQILII